MVKIIDADAHMSEPYTLWTERIDRQFRAHAPRVVEGYQGKPGTYWVFENMSMALNPGREGASRHMERPGGWDPAARLKDMAIEGIAGAVLYSTLGLGMYCCQNPELQEACFRVYNDWLAEFCAYAPERFAGLALIALWDVERGVRELERSRKLGLKGAMSWSVPPRKLPPYSAPAYDRFWAAAQELQMPVSFHLNTSGDGAVSYYTRDSMGDVYTRMVMVQSEVQSTLLSLIFNGVLSRFPKLRLVSVEGDVGWIPPLLARADKYYSTRVRRGHDYDIGMEPSEYFRRNVWATFIKDPVGVQTYRINDWVDRICWSTDYPHPACYFPDSQKILQEDFAGVPEADKRKIIYDNASELYGLHP